jgi:hypothetical protein
MLEKKDLTGKDRHPTLLFVIIYCREHQHQEKAPFSFS